MPLIAHNEHGAGSQQFDTTFNWIVNNSNNVVIKYGLNCTDKKFDLNTQGCMMT